jgi:ubiquinone/menaquinone biosynthesis C-methylase UbiE
MQREDYAHLCALEEDFWWFAGMREITAALLDRVCAPGADRVILDAGCGTGGMLAWLKRYAGQGRVVGVDLVAEALGFCRARGQRGVAQASVTDLPFADESFDLLTSFDVLVQVPGARAEAQALREMYRVLRRGGLAFVRVAAYQWMWSGHDEALGTQRRYQLGELTAKLESAGFRVVRATYANSLLLPAAALRRLVLARLNLAPGGSDVRPLPPELRWLNQVLLRALRNEARWLRWSQSGLPAGLSAICLAEKARG